jgi:hypothetical protein
MSWLCFWDDFFPKTPLLGVVTDNIDPTLIHLYLCSYQTINKVDEEIQVVILEPDHSGGKASKYTKTLDHKVDEEIQDVILEPNHFWW